MKSSFRSATTCSASRALGERGEGDDVGEEHRYRRALAAERERVLAADDGVDERLAHEAAEIAAQLGLVGDLGLALLQVLRTSARGSA